MIQIFVLIVLIFLLLPKEIKPENIEIIKVRGQSILSSPNFYDEAVDDALREAVRMAGGIKIKNITIVENYLLSVNKTFTRTDGFVKGYKKIKEQKDSANDLFYVYLEVSVNTADLKDNLSANCIDTSIDIDVIYDWIGKPKIMAVVKEYIDKNESELNYARTEIENVLLKNEIHIASQEQIQEIKNTDISNADDVKKARAFAMRFGAEIIITGKCISNFSRIVSIDNNNFIFYTSNIELRAINSATGEILISEKYDNIIPTNKEDSLNLGYLSANDAAQNSIKDLVSVSINDFCYKLFSNFTRSISKAQKIELIISGVKGKLYEKLIQYLKKIPKISKLSPRNLINNTAFFDIEYKGNIETLKNNILKSKDMNFEFVSFNNNRLEYSIKSSESPKLIKQNIITLNISEIDLKFLKEFKKILESIDKNLEINQISFSSGIAVLQLNTRQSSDNLAELILERIELQNLNIQILSVDKNKIDLIKTNR
ncbi:MAG TPA: hypothetical protein PKY81_02630 [bacterium]|nr:hypothetical protein [bacterium]